MAKIRRGMNKPIWFDYWGKAGTGDSLDGDWHPLVYHCLDVAAVADRLLVRNPRLTERLVALSGLSPTTLRAWVGFFVALHDVGKFASAFQQLRSELVPARSRRYFYSVRHDTLGFVFWRQRLVAWFESVRAWECSDPDAFDYLLEVFDQWALAVMGHHGQPPKFDSEQPLGRFFAPEDELAARAFADDLAALFLKPEATLLPQPTKALYDRVRPFSWWLAGLTVLADWIGSNRDFFPYVTERLPLACYWLEVALPAADHALDRTGLLPNDAMGALGIEALFEGIHQPTPLQAACLECPIGDAGPRLFLLEDVTGAGKTEAAFILLNRLLAAGAASGAYLALPTMATANAMYRRTATVYHHLFHEESRPANLVLAHGSRQLDDGFRESLVPSTEGAGEYERGENNATARCNAWFADRSKKALLAQMGVGTVDQALLAVLTSRHQSLRLLGLLDKVLIVDEVHASDAYMHRLLCALLAMHARGGGSAILLSATLPQTMRAELADAFCRGAGRTEVDLSETAYPLLTGVTVNRDWQRPVATRDSVVRTLGFSRFSSEDAVLDWIVDRANGGACIAWVRNSVADAINASRLLGERLSTERVDLFHARFCTGDRLAFEDRVVDAFGRYSGPSSRRGRVVIATQVVEQSLDLDFDEMVSDLAPVDLLLQRAGRLRRHCRDVDGKPIDSADQRGQPVLQVLMPDPDHGVDDKWYARLLPHAAPVYPDHGRLWLTARLLKDRSRVALPSELRTFIEGVFGPDPVAELPAGLQLRSNRAEGQRQADASLARFNVIKSQNGYRHDGEIWWDESFTPTRLGEPTITVRLARWDGKELQPWSDDTNHPWAMSEVKVRRALLAEAVIEDESALEKAVERVREEWPRGLDDLVLLPMTSDDGQLFASKAMDGKGNLKRVVYLRRFGLQVFGMEKG